MSIRVLGHFYSLACAPLSLISVANDMTMAMLGHRDVVKQMWWKQDMRHLQHRLRHEEICLGVLPSANKAGWPPILGPSSQDLFSCLPFHLSAPLLPISFCLPLLILFPLQSFSVSFSWEFSDWPQSFHFPSFCVVLCLLVMWAVFAIITYLSFQVEEGRLSLSCWLQLKFGPEVL